MRSHLTFACKGDTLVGTLDAVRPNATGLLIVSGGNEVRGGAHRGMSRLAARLAAAGHPVFRYDRRGIGDSSGENGGYASAAPDLGAAIEAFREAAPEVARIVGFGNCDAATTLALFGREAGVDAVVLANPWVVETADALPPAAAIRRRYAQRLVDPRAWWRLASGGVDVARLGKGLAKLSKREPQQLADRVVAAIAGWAGDARIVMASEDATAVAFAAAAAARQLRTAVTTVDTASHSFAHDEDAEALEAAILTALALYRSG